MIDGLNVIEFPLSRRILKPSLAIPPKIEINRVLEQQQTNFERSRVKEARNWGFLIARKP